MSPSTLWGLFAAILALLFGLWLFRAGRGMRLRRGLGSGTTVSLDNVTLVSHRLGLIGRPDRLVKGDGTIVPEEQAVGSDLVFGFPRRKKGDILTTDNYHNLLCPCFPGSVDAIGLQGKVRRWHAGERR